MPLTNSTGATSSWDKVRNNKKVIIKGFMSERELIE
jgi:hypothetical protein